MPSNHFICCPLLLPSIFPSIRVFSNESALHIRWPKYLSFSIRISPYNEYSRLSSLRIDSLISLQPNRLSRVFSNTAIQYHQFFSAQPSLWSSSHIHTWLLEKKKKQKKHNFDIWTIVGKEMSLFFNMLCRFVTDFLPWTHHLLTSWLQSPSAAILESKKINSLTISIVSPSICHQVIGPDAWISIF